MASEARGEVEPMVSWRLLGPRFASTFVLPKAGAGGRASRRWGDMLEEIPFKKRTWGWRCGSSSSSSVASAKQ
jgi:hypothetical protein